MHCVYLELPKVEASSFPAEEQLQNGAHEFYRVASARRSGLAWELQVDLGAGLAARVQRIATASRSLLLRHDLDADCLGCTAVDEGEDDHSLIDIR
jgi:hypothetical protein